MQNHLFVTLAILVLLGAALITAFNPILAGYVVVGVLLFGLGLLIYRIKFGR